MKQYLDDIANGVNVKPAPKDWTAEWILSLIIMVCLFGLYGGVFMWFVLCAAVDKYMSRKNL